VEECTEQRIAKRAGKLKGHNVNAREACEGNKRLNARGYGVTNTQTQQKYGRHSNLPGTHQVTHEDVYRSKHKAQTKGREIPRGGTPWNFWWGCAARISKYRPNFRPKNAFSHTRFQT